MTRSFLFSVAAASTLVLAGCGTTHPAPTRSGSAPVTTHPQKHPTKHPAAPTKHGLAALQWRLLKVAPANNANPILTWSPVAVDVSITNPTNTAVSLIKGNLALWGVYPVNPPQPWTAFPYVGNMRGFNGTGPAITQTPLLFPDGGLTSPTSTTLTPEIVPPHHTISGWVLLATANGIKQTELVLLPHASAAGAGTPIPIPGTAFSAP